MTSYPEPSEEDLWARHQLVDLLPRYGRVDEAIELLQDRAGRDKSAAEHLVDLLVEHQRVEDLTSRADAGDSNAAERLADLLARQGRESELGRRVDEGDAYAGARLADLLRDQHRTQNALDLLRNHVPAWWAERRLADLLAENGNADEAVAMLEASEHVKAKRHLVRLLAARGQIEGAIDTLLSIAEKDTAWARDQLIDLLLQQGRSGEAVTLLRDRADAGDHWWAARRLVKLLAELGQIEELRTRAAKDPDAAQRLVDVLIQQGRADEAISLCHSHANAGKRWARERLTELLARYERTDEIRALADAGDPYAAAWLVESLVDQGRIDQAITLLRIRADAGDWWAAQQPPPLIHPESQSRT